MFAFPQWHTKCENGDLQPSDSLVVVWFLFILLLVTKTLKQHYFLQFKLDISCLAIIECTLFLLPFMEPLCEPAFYKHNFPMFLSSASLPHPVCTPSSLSTLFPPSPPPAFSCCYLPNSVLHFQICQMFSIQQHSRSGAVFCRTVKLFISHLSLIADFRASATSKVGVSCKTILLIWGTLEK